MQTISDLLEQLVTSLLASLTLLKNNNNVFQIFQPCENKPSRANASCRQAGRFHSCGRSNDFESWRLTARSLHCTSCRYNCCSHLAPTNEKGQRQSKDDRTGTHTPKFLQGLGIHGSGSSKMKQ